MALLWGVVGYALYIYILLILARLVLDWTRQFARAWRPAGVAAIGLRAGLHGRPIRRSGCCGDWSHRSSWVL